MVKEEDFVDKTDFRTQNPVKLIRKLAEQQGITLREPKSSCKKCHGLGYIGRRVEDGFPIPCSCIIVKEKLSERDIGNVERKPKNRAERRKAGK